MTLDQFLAHLATHERGRGWVITPEGLIRRPGPEGNCCPLSAAGDRPACRFMPPDFDEPFLATNIMDAADARPHHDRALRARLCAALGLEDTAR